MSNIAKKLLKEGVVYSVGPILEKLIGIVLIPIYTAYLTPSDYGVLQYIITIGAFFIPVIGAGLATSFWRFRSDDNLDQGEVALHVVLGQLMVGTCVVIGMVFVYFNAYNTTVGFLLTVYIVSRALMVVYQCTLLVLQAHHRVYFYLFLSVAYATSLALSSIVFIVLFELNYSGVIYSAFSVTLLFSVFFSWPLIKEVKWSFSWKLFKEIFKYGIPLAYANMAAIVITFSDVIFLKWLATDYEVGLYSFGYKFAMLVNVFLVTSFFKSWNPMRWEIYKKKNGKEIFNRVYEGLLTLLPFFALLVIAGSVLLASFLSQNPDYLLGLLIVPVVGGAYVFYAIYYFNIMGILFADKTKYISRIMMGCAGLNLILNYLLIPKYGMYGASVATLISYMCMAALSIVVSQRLYTITRNRILEVGQLSLFSVVVMSFVFLPSDFPLNVAGFFFLLILASIVLLVSGFMFNPKIYSEIKHAILSMKNKKRLKM